MRGVIGALAVFSAEAFAHPEAEAHVHGIGFEHVLLFAIVLGLLAYALKK